MKPWVARVTWLAMGALLWFGCTDIDMPLATTVWLVVSTVAWLVLGVWWVKRGEK